MGLLHMLPPELIQSVIQEVGRDQLFTLRLTCKALCKHATAHAFSDINIWLQEESLQTLVKIAQAPHLAQHVRHISCGMEEFYDVEFDVFSTYIYTNNMPGNLPKITDSQLRDTYQVYKRYTCRQDFMRDRDQDLKTLAQAFKAFSGLVSVLITDVWPDSLDFLIDPAEPKLRILQREPLLLLRMFEPLSQPIPRGHHQLETMTKALAKSGTKLSDFALQLSPHYHGGYDGPLSPLNCVAGAIEDAYRSLKYLNIDLGGGMHPPSSTTLSAERFSIASILNVCKNLEHLSLVGLGSGDDNSLWSRWSHLYFESLVGAPRLDTLQTLWIDIAAFDKHVLSNFILRSCRGLRDLQITTARLNSGTWASLFKSLRQLPSLEVCELRNLKYEYNGPNGWTTLLRDIESMHVLSDYLCVRTNTDPWPGIIAEELRQIAEEDSDEDEDED